MEVFSCKCPNRCFKLTENIRNITQVVKSQQSNIQVHFLFHAECILLKRTKTKVMVCVANSSISKTWSDKTKLKPSGLWVWLTKATWAGAQLWSHLHSTFTSASSPSQKPAFLFPASAQPANLSGYWRWCCSSESGGVLTGFNPPQGWALPHTDPGGQHQPDQQESASAQSSQQGANS